METNDSIFPTPPTNRYSIVSLILGILSLSAICGAMVPLPLTGFICLPAAFLAGTLALIYGIVSLNGIRKNNEAGKPLAWMGILSGGFIFLCMACALAAILSLFIFAPDSVQPILENYNL